MNYAIHNKKNVTCDVEAQLQGEEVIDKA